MDPISALLLATSATFASVRNMLTKSFSGFCIKSREFFGIQAAVFGAGSIILTVVCLFDFKGIAPLTVLLALIYGAMLLCAQWFYTIALTTGKTAICTTIYSFGFVLPTLSGVLFWNESISVFGILGILTVIPVLIISGLGSKKAEGKESSKGYIIPLIIALLCSGGLGIVQKIQQTSEFKDQKSIFILIAFLFSFLVSLIFFLCKKPGEKKISKRNLCFCSIAGSFFAINNLLNTHLAGVLDSAIFFPAINIGVILISVVLGLIVYKERLALKDILVLCLGAAAIVLVNF
ncbi:MAG: EamA family transporter [Clostridia bacterium]|nr:EamA family transporter [Clostridia bacterium]